MKEKCKAKVFDGWRFHSCPRYASIDGFCKQHHPDTVAERHRKRDERFRQKMDASPLSKCIKRTQELEAEIRRLKGAP